MDNLDDLLRLVTSPGYFFDRDSHQIIACNQQFATLMEYEIHDLLTMSVEQLRPPAEIPLLARALAASHPEGFELRQVLLEVRGELEQQRASVPLGPA